jgi:dienelactone hydrolase
LEYGVLQPVIDGLQRTPEGVQLNWTPSDPGYDYTVQSNIRLEGGLWTLATCGEPWPVAGTEVVVDSGEGPLFFRLLAVPAAERGRVLAVTKSSSYSTFQITFMFNLAGISVTPRYGVDTYTVRYETIDPWGARTEATGLLALPQGQSGPLPLASYQHGTVMETNDVPSMDLQQSIPGVGLASQGYATVLPDFLGLGGSPGFHPYHHARSEATSAIDLLRAARAWASTNGVSFDGQLYLCGYSQGGHATMALHRELETYYPSEFTVRASAPMAGAHDLSGTTLDDFMSGRPLPNPYYVAYFLAAYQSVYQITNSWADWLAEPYATTLPPLLEARASSADINAAMPSNATLIFKPEVMQAVLDDPQHPLRLALADNDLYDWASLAPIRMWHCLSDMDVPYENSVVALAGLQANGAPSVELLDPSPSAGHGDCAIPSFMAMAAWFDSLR